MRPLSPHIVDIRWRIAAEEKARRTPPLAIDSGQDWSAQKMKGVWGIGAVVGRRLYFRPVRADEFEQVNSRYRQQARA